MEKGKHFLNKIAKV